MDIEIMDVPGHGEQAKTWVVPVTFLSDLAPKQLLVLETILESKPFKVGFFTIPNSTKRLFIVHFQKETRRDQCAKALKDVWRLAGVQASIEEMVMFNGYHLELFGFRPNPGPALPKKVEPDVELDEGEQTKIWEDLLPESDDDSTPQSVCMDKVDKAFQEALNEKEMVLALRPPASSSSGSAYAVPPRSNVGPYISWCTEPPSELEVVTRRTLREWQKLEWVLLRCESEEMRTSPSLDQFADFFAIYLGISTVDNQTELLKQAFNTFAKHVKKTTGATVSKKELPPATLNAVRGIQKGAVPGKHCQNCNHILSDELMMDINGGLIPKHRHGMFCSSECAKGRCKGCSFPLDKESLCVKRCGIRPHAVVRQATWREYFELYPKLQPEAAAWCQEKLHTSSEELLNSTDRLVSYGGYFQISPDAWF